MTTKDANAELAQQLLTDIWTWENQEVEFKKTATSDHEIAEAIAGFATSNVARIYIGVDDDRTITGVPNASNGVERDDFQRRIARISKDLVKPPTRVRVSFVEIDTKIVVRIDVPKGTDPAYFVDYRAYIRDLSTTRKLEPSELKSLHQQYFVVTLGQISDKRISFFVDLIFQLSDVQVINSDYMDHLIKPDIYQLKYDLDSTAQRISNLSVTEFSEELAIASPLKQLNGCLEDAAAHEFYIGMESVIAFGKKLQVCTSAANMLLEQVKKNCPTSILPEFEKLFSENIELIINEWSKSEKYLQRGELEKLRDAFRRFGFTFHRLGSLPDADKYPGLSIKLKEIGERVRNLSSTQKYFLPGMGFDPLNDIRKTIEPILNELENLKNTL